MMRTKVLHVCVRAPGLVGGRCPYTAHGARERIIELQQEFGGDALLSQVRFARAMSAMSLWMPAGCAAPPRRISTRQTAERVAVPRTRYRLAQSSEPRASLDERASTTSVRRVALLARRASPRVRVQPIASEGKILGVSAWERRARPTKCSASDHKLAGDPDHHVGDDIRVDRDRSQ